MWEVNILRTLISKNVFILASHLTDSLAEYWILSWGSFPFRILKVLFHWLLCSSVAVERTKIIWIPSSLKVTLFLLFLEACGIFVLSVGWNSTVIQWGVGLFSYIMETNSKTIILKRWKLLASGKGNGMVGGGCHFHHKSYRMISLFLCIYIFDLKIKAKRKGKDKEEYGLRSKADLCLNLESLTWLPGYLWVTWHILTSVFLFEMAEHIVPLCPVGWLCDQGCRRFCKLWRLTPQEVLASFIRHRRAWGSLGDGWSGSCVFKGLGKIKRVSFPAVQPFLPFSSLSTLCYYRKTSLVYMVESGPGQL